MPGLTTATITDQVMWLQRAVADAERATDVSFLLTGPSGFEARAVISHLDGDPDQSDIERFRLVVETLGALTRNVDEYVVALWTGVEQPAVDGSWLTVDVSIREYAVRVCTLPQLDAVLSQAPIDLPPGLLWPTDQSWLLWSDIDLSWTGLAGSDSTVERLCAAGHGRPMTNSSTKPVLGA